MACPFCPSNGEITSGKPLYHGFPPRNCALILIISFHLILDLGRVVLSHWMRMAGMHGGNAKWLPEDRQGSVRDHSWRRHCNQRDTVSSLVSDIPMGPETKAGAHRRVTPASSNPTAPVETS